MRTLVVFLLAALAGCMSQTLESYVGRDIRDVMTEAGPPDNAFDMGDGRRAFQWVQDGYYSTPTTSTTTEVYGGDYDAGWVMTNTQISGGRTINAPCFYTVFGRWDPTQEAWIVTEYQKPKIECE